MAKSGCLVLGFLLASGSWGCLLYTDPINRAPDVKLTGDTVVTWGMSTNRGRYHAEAHDPDQSAASLSYEWRRQVGPCPDSLAAAKVAPVVSTAGADYENDATFPDPFCVWVVVTDSDKAEDFAVLTTQVMYPDTTAVIDVIKPQATSDDHYPLFSAVRLSGAASSAPDQGKLTLHWTLTRNGGPVTPTPCPEAPETDICFTADQAGDYQVTLTVKDPRNREATKSRKVVIEPDSPPCIRRTMPELLPRLVRDPNGSTEDLTFEVKSVQDDGDPFPAADGRTSMFSFTATWWLEGEDSNNPSGRRPADQGQSPSLVFTPNYFRNGDRVFVRFQVNDRVARDFSACARDKMDNCALGSDRTCFQWVTWKVDFLLGPP